MSVKHIIQKFRLDARVEEEKSHFQLMSSVSDFAKEDLCKVLEEVLDSLGLEDRIVRIDKLEIDLGTIQWRDRSLLKERFRAALLQELTFPLVSQSHQKLEAVQDSSASKKRELSKTEERRERWEHYLKYGNLPWWDQTASAIDFNLTEDLEILIGEDFRFFHSILERAGRDKFLFFQISRRLFQFLGDQTFERIYSGTELSTVEELAALYHPLKNIITTVSELQFRQETLWIYFSAPQKAPLRNIVAALSSSLQLAPEKTWMKLLPVVLHKNNFPTLRQELRSIWENTSMRLEFIKRELPSWYERAAHTATALGSEEWVVALSDVLQQDESVSSRLLSFAKEDWEKVALIRAFLEETGTFQEEWIPRALSVRLSSMEELPEQETIEAPDAKSYNWLLRYLKTGSLPWVQRQFSREDIEALIVEMYDGDPVYFREFFSKVDLFRFPQVWERIEKQFSPAVKKIFESALKVKLYLDRKKQKAYRENILQLFFTKGLVPWKDLLDGNEERILEILITYFREDPVFFRRAIRESKIIQNPILKKKIVEVLGERVWKFLLEQSEEKEGRTAATVKSLTLVDLMTDFDELALQLEYYFKTGKFLSEVTPSFREVLQALSAIKTRDARLMLAVYHHRYPELVETTLGEAWTKELREELSFETKKETEEEPDEIEIPEYLKPTASQEKREKTEADKLMPEGTVMYIRNSGLVLLHPFLSRYFSMLKLTEKRAFVNDDAMERAVHLLQYLVYEKSDMPEFELVLNKILCGMAPVLPVKSNIDLTDQEKELSESLLKGVIENWSILKNTSIENFRASFLHREGRLSKEPDGWRLRVEQKGYDVLLKNIPWAYSTVKLPWMKEVVYVDWTT